MDNKERIKAAVGKAVFGLFFPLHNGKRLKIGTDLFLLQSESAMVIKETSANNAGRVQIMFNGKRWWFNARKAFDNNEEQYKPGEWVNVYYFRDEICYIGRNGEI